MRLTLKQLQAFLAVAESKSTTAAAGRVSLSQSATSAALNELEAMLRIRLFDRVGKRLVLNENGRLLLPQARQMLDLGGSIEKQFSSAEAFNCVEARVGASTTVGIYLLPSLLAAWSAARTLRVRPEVIVANTSDVVEAVANFDADFGFIEGACRHDDLDTELWVRDELIIVCAPTHPLVNGSNSNKINVRSLRQTEWLSREPGSGTREAVEHALLPHLHHLNSIGQFSNSEAIKQAAAAGLGVACLSRWVVADLVATGQLVEISTTLPKLFRNFYLIHNKRKVLSARMADLLNYCRKWPVDNST